MGSTNNDFCALTIIEAQKETSKKEPSKKPSIKPLVEYAERTQIRILENLKETHANLVTLGKAGFSREKRESQRLISVTTDKAYQFIQTMHKQLLENADPQKWDLEDDDDYDSDEDDSYKPVCVIV